MTRGDGVGNRGVPEAEVASAWVDQRLNIVRSNLFLVRRLTDTCREGFATGE
jgi:hypothetical protein